MLYAQLSKTTLDNFFILRLMLFDFNIYSSLLLVGFVQGLVYAGLLLNRGIRYQRTPDKLMAVLLLLCCLYVSAWMLGFAGWYDVHDWHTTIMFYIPFDQILFLGPLVYFYFRSLTNADFKWSVKHSLHFLPGIFLLFEPLSTFLHDIVYSNLIMGEALPFFYGTKGSLKMFRESIPFPYFGLLGTAKMFHLLTYLILTVITYQNYRKYLLNNFAASEAFSFSWLRNLLYIFLIGLGLAGIVRIYGQFHDLSYAAAWYSYFFLAIMIYVLSIQSFHATVQLPKEVYFEPVQVQPNTTVSPEEPTADILDWKKRLAAFMDKNESYLDPDINLAELAKRMSTNTSHLSKVVNLGYQQNFNDFINSYRIEALIKRLQKGDHKNLTFLSLALDCGFNSKATFNRAFKKYTGKSPGQFVVDLEIPGEGTSKNSVGTTSESA